MNHGNQQKGGTIVRHLPTTIAKTTRRRLAVAAIIPISLFGCGGGGGGGSTPAPTPTSHAVTISWTPNREVEVNKAGGGYTVAISGQAPINVPYVAASGVTPTSVPTTLMSGNYSVTVTAYSALNPPGGTTGSKSAPSAAYSFSVPY